MPTYKGSMINLARNDRGNDRSHFLTKRQARDANRERSYLEEVMFSAPPTTEPCPMREKLDLMLQAKSEAQEQDARLNAEAEFGQIVKQLKQLVIDRTKDLAACGFFYCSCLHLDSGLHHQKGCVVKIEIKRRLKIEGSYNEFFALDRHFHNKDGSIVRVRINHGLDNTHCHCSFVAENKNKHWDMCVTKRPQVERTPEPAVESTYTYQPTMQDLEDTEPAITSRYVFKSQTPAFVFGFEDDDSPEFEIRKPRPFAAYDSLMRYLDDRR